MIGPDYGVPTGYVPRVERSGFAVTVEPMIPDDSRVVPMMEPPDPIQQAVDRWIDMERKAKAWDKLQHEVKVNEQLTCASTAPEVLDWLDSLLDSPHPSA